MRGDRPPWHRGPGWGLWFTPHARGSTHLPKKSILWDSVYPACAGIDPVLRHEDMAAPGLPRMRGDRPHKFRESASIQKFTPHARGSTLRQ